LQQAVADVAVTAIATATATATAIATLLRRKTFINILPEFGARSVPRLRIVNPTHPNGLSVGDLDIIAVNSSPYREQQR